MARLQRGMEDLFEALASGRPTATSPWWSNANLFPLLNVYEREDCYIVTAEIPGIKKDDLEIKMEGDTLSLKGERQHQQPEGQAAYHRRERAKGSFQRSITLPGKVDPQKVKANYKDGVLTVTLAKEPAALPKQIDIVTE